MYPRKGCHLLLMMDHSDPAQESAMPVPVAMANSNSNMADVSSVQAYNFVPMFNPEEMAARRREQRKQARTQTDSSTESESDKGNPPPPPPDPMANKDWCSCRNCAPIDRPIQCQCCEEVPNCRHFLDDGVPCITRNEDFSRVCLQKAVLRMASVARLDCQGHARARLPEELDSE